MYEDGDIVRYIGTEKSLLVGSDILRDWCPWNIPCLLGIVIKNRFCNSNILKTNIPVIEYNVRSLCRDRNNISHEINTFYDFELEEAI